MICLVCDESLAEDHRTEWTKTVDGSGVTSDFSDEEYWDREYSDEEFFLRTKIEMPRHLKRSPNSRRRRSTFRPSSFRLPSQNENPKVFTLSPNSTAENQGFIQPPRRGEYSPLKQMYSPLREDHQLPPQGGVPVLREDKVCIDASLY